MYNQNTFYPFQETEHNKIKDFRIAECNESIENCYYLLTQDVEMINWPFEYDEENGVKDSDKCEHELNVSKKHYIIHGIKDIPHDKKPVLLDFDEKEYRCKICKRRYYLSNKVVSKNYKLTKQFERKIIIESFDNQFSKVKENNLLESDDNISKLFSEFIDKLDSKRVNYKGFFSLGIICTTRKNKNYTLLYNRRYNYLIDFYESGVEDALSKYALGMKKVKKDDKFDALSFITDISCDIDSYEEVLRAINARHLNCRVHIDFSHFLKKCIEKYERQEDSKIRLFESIDNISKICESSSNDVSSSRHSGMMRALRDFWDDVNASKSKALGEAIRNSINDDLMLLFNNPNCWKSLDDRAYEVIDRIGNTFLGRIDFKVFRGKIIYNPKFNICHPRIEDQKKVYSSPKAYKQQLCAMFDQFQSPIEFFIGVYENYEDWVYVGVKFDDALSMLDKEIFAE